MKVEHSTIIQTHGINAKGGLDRRERATPLKKKCRKALIERDTAKIYKRFKPAELVYCFKGLEDFGKMRTGMYPKCFGGFLFSTYYRQNKKNELTDRYKVIF